MAKIQRVHAREILDSRGNPTIEVDILLDDGSFGRAAVPSGASTGSREAVELRDDDDRRFNRKGVLKAVAHVNSEIAEAITGVDPSDQMALDSQLISLDGTENKSKLGANAILGVSMAAARAAADQMDIPLYRYLATKVLKTKDLLLPTPMFNILNGGVHADNSVDLQEFMIAPVGADSFRNAVRMAAEVYHSLKGILKKKGYHTSIGDEGGFAPQLKANVEAIELILAAIEQAHYRAGKDIVIAMDPAASEFYKDGHYVFSKSDGSKKDSDQMIKFYADWIRQFPIASLEDGLAENDWEGWRNLTKELGGKIQLVGDDIFVTNPKILQEGIERKVANAVLIKLNQIGTVTETLTTMSMAKSAGYGLVVSHRSGETPDDFISDFSVATSAGQIKTGAPARGERVAKYNQLIRIEEELGNQARFAGVDPFRPK